MKKILFLYVFFIVSTTFPGMATETIEYYVDGTLYDTTTCQAGDDIILPTTAPTKTGYTFSGWDYRTFDMSTLDHTINGVTSYSGLTWKDVFSYGTVYGTGICSSTPGSTIGETGNPVSAVGINCWCRVTKFLRGYDNFLYEPEVSVWVWVYSYSNCGSLCGYYCVDRVKQAAVRAALYGK